mgnify:CR=1 FL=1
MSTQLTIANYRPLVESALTQVLRLAFLQRGTVANLAALASLDVTRYADAALVYVTDQTRVYQLSLLSGAAPSSPDVIAPSTPSAKYPRARWLRVTSSATYGPNAGAPLHSRSEGILRAVALYAGEGGADAQLAACMEAVPSIMIDQDGDTVAPLSAGYPGALYRVELGYAVMVFARDLRGAPQSILSTEAGAESPACIIGQLRKVLAGMSGDALGLEGVDRIEIGDSALVQEGEAERAHVYSAAITVICYVTNPDEDLVGLVIDAQPELTDAAQGGRFDTLNYVAQGYYFAVPVPASLTAQLAAGVATIAGSAVASSPAAHTFTASRDTYCDLAADGSVTYSEVYPDHAAPSQADGTLRLGVVTTDAAGVTGWRTLCSYSEVLRSYYQIAP